MKHQPSNHYTFLLAWWSKWDNSNVYREYTWHESGNFILTCEGCYKSNASYFITLAHDVRGGCRWYSSRGWTFPPIFCYILWLCDRWQQRGPLTKWCVTYECGWSKGASLNYSMQKKWCPLTFTNFAEHLWRPNSGFEHSEVMGGTFQWWWQQQWSPSGADRYEQKK